MAGGRTGAYSAFPRMGAGKSPKAALAPDRRPAEGREILRHVAPPALPAPTVERHGLPELAPLAGPAVDDDLHGRPRERALTGEDVLQVLEARRVRARHDDEQMRHIRDRAGDARLPQQAQTLNTFSFIA